MQVTVHHNSQTSLHTMKEESKALCTDWAAYRPFHIDYRQNIPTARSTQSILHAKIPHKRHTGGGKMAKRNGKSRSRGVGPGDSTNFPWGWILREGGKKGGEKSSKRGDRGWEWSNSILSLIYLKHKDARYMQENRSYITCVLCGWKRIGRWYARDMGGMGGGGIKGGGGFQK